MINLYKPETEEELLIIKSILESENIPNFIHNERFGSLWVGPKIDLYNAKTIMVPEEQYDRSRELIEDFLNSIKDKTEVPRPRYSLLDKIRMIFEALIFMWFIPGKKEKKE